MDSKMRGLVRCLPYDPEWKVQFGLVRDMLAGSLGEITLAIEHVGSTSVEGLAAKPILDLDVVIATRYDLPEVERRLVTLSFFHYGDGDIPGREIFRRTFEDEFMAYHVYVCAQDSVELSQHLAFRDWLRSHPEDRDAYGRLKTELAARFPHDIDGYMAGKHDFIQERLARIADEENGKEEVRL
jgi:GrpB-like predicted nucleotidyltransferase (UPF0157 family)